MQGWSLPAAAYVLTVLMIATVLSAILTLLAFHRFDQLVDRLVPDVVMINTFPRMSHIVEYMELTGERRKLIVADLHLGTPSARHLRHKDALARAQAVEGIAG